MNFEDKLLVDFEEAGADDRIRELIEEAGDDINKKYMIWNALDDMSQLCFKELFEDLKGEMIEFEDRVRLWMSTKYLVQMKNVSFFDELMSLCEEYSKNEKDATVEFNVLENTTKVIIAKANNLDVYLNTINEYANVDMHVPILEFYDEKLKNLMGRDNIRDSYYTLIEKCRKDFLENPTLAKALAYNFKADEMFIIEESEELFAANPEIFFETLMSETNIDKFGIKTISAVINREGAKLPEDILDLLNEIDFSRELTNKLLHQKPLVTLALLQRANDAIEDLGKEECADRLFFEEMQLLQLKPEIKKESKYREEILRTLESTIEYAHITENTFELVRLFTTYKQSLKEIFNEYPLDNLEFKEIWENLKREISKNPADIVGHMQTATINEFSADVFCEGIIELQKMPEGFKAFYTLSAEEYKKLIDAKVFPENLVVDIVCKNASQISVEDLEKSEGKFKCNSIRFADKNISSIQKHPYSIEQYIRCREVIDELIEDVVMPQVDDLNRDKKIFMQVASRLAYHIEYNYTCLSESKKIAEQIKEIKYKNADEITEEDRTNKIMELRTKQEAMDIEARDMAGGLLTGTAVCAGYAEILRNVMPFFDIDATYIRGSKESNTAGHAWNQVRLDNVWYNVDLTWARDELIKFDSSNYLLQDDKTFNTGSYDYISANGEAKHKILMRHDTYSKSRSPEEKCALSVSPKEQREFGIEAEDGITYSEWINGAAYEVTTSDITRAQKIMEYIMRAAKESSKHEQDKYDR